MVYVHPRSPLLRPSLPCASPEAPGKALATFSISSSFSCDHESPRNHQVWPRAGMSQQPSLGSFYLHRNIWQQTRHFLAVIQHVILTHIRCWQPLFTPFYAHEWWPTKQNFKWAQVCFHSFSHSHVHQYNWEGFKPSQTRLFTAFRQFVLNCLVLSLYCPTWRGRVAAVCSHVNSQELTHLLYCIIDKVSAIVRTDFSWKKIFSFSSFATAAESCFEVGKASTHFDHMSTITRQCFCFPQGVNSMKSIITYSNGPAGAGWDAKGVFIPLATLCVLQVTHLLQKFSATTVNPFVNHNSLICIIIPAFDTWSNPCVNLA